MEHGSTVSFEEIKQELLKKTNWENKECEAYLSNQKWIIETLKEDLTVERTYHDYDYNETIKAGALVKRSTSRPNYEVYEITPERAKLGFVPVIEEGKEEPNLYQERIFVSKEPIGSEKSHVDNDVYPTYLVCRPGYYDDAFYSFEVPQPEIVEKFSLLFFCFSNRLIVFLLVYLFLLFSLYLKFFLLCVVGKLFYLYLV